MFSLDTCGWTKLPVTGASPSDGDNFHAVLDPSGVVGPCGPCIVMTGSHGLWEYLNLGSNDMKVKRIDVRNKPSEILMNGCLFILDNQLCFFGGHNWNKELKDSPGPPAPSSSDVLYVLKVEPPDDIWGKDELKEKSVSELREILGRRNITDTYCEKDEMYSAVIKSNPTKPGGKTWTWSESLLDEDIPPRGEIAFTVSTCADGVRRAIFFGGFAFRGTYFEDIFTFNFEEGWIGWEWSTSHPPAAVCQATLCDVPNCGLLLLGGYGDAEGAHLVESGNTIPAPNNARFLLNLGMRSATAPTLSFDMSQFGRSIPGTKRVHRVGVMKTNGGKGGIGDPMVFSDPLYAHWPPFPDFPTANEQLSHLKNTKPKNIHRSLVLRVSMPTEPPIERVIQCPSTLRLCEFADQVFFPSFDLKRNNHGWLFVDPQLRYGPLPYGPVGTEALDWRFALLMGLKACSDDRPKLGDFLQTVGDKIFIVCQSS